MLKKYILHIEIVKCTRKIFRRSAKKSVSSNWFVEIRLFYSKIWGEEKECQIRFRLFEEKEIKNVQAAIKVEVGKGGKVFGFPYPIKAPGANC